jgi:hypothetical protein
MRSAIYVGLVACAIGAVSCSTQDVSAPAKRQITAPSLTKGGPSDGCDAKKQECTVDGRMTGGGGQVTIGNVYITRGLTVHCDIVLSNNLEINWPGNSWHLDKPLTSAQCVDDPAISPEPPPAPFDTFIGEGIGRLNGVDGYLVKFTFVDSGEPGGSNDRSQIQIFSPDGVLVLDVPMSFLTKGNLQAHYDQPHG